MEDKFAVICVNHNSMKATHAYYVSICTAAKFAGVFVDFVVVDNSAESQVGELEAMMGKGSSNVAVDILSSENNGYFAGLNKGLGALVSDDYKYWLVSNNDIELADDFFSDLMQVKNPSDCYVLCPRVLDQHLMDQNPRQIGAYSKGKKTILRMYYASFLFALPIVLGMWLLKRFRRQRVHSVPNGVCKIVNGYGAVYILNKAFFANCEKLPEDVFLFGEEVLLHRDVSGAGGSIYFNPSLLCHHNSSSSVGALGWYKYYLIQKQSFRIYGEYL